MKLLGRILLILVAALVVVGITMGLARTSVGSSLFAGRDRFAQRQPGGQAFTGALPNQNFAQGNLGEVNRRNNGFNRGDFPGGFARGGRGGASLFGMTEVIRNLGIMSIVVAVVVLGSRMVGGRRRAAPAELAAE